ncbi:ADP-ribosylglycohydrolase [Andreprevotia lacus DSM 23236]|jgi:poly(ADP-ribose) glycohydrolase ARH3|uniref:ADP-ribosylglycohydrolase n=1 Tax=Andreprevotia lacus DSM 23236 TaxID=1121001 RepID=A0A1W1XZF4_9NEIS|nr:ADP-ribosylglycohydrolase family protein [Andreprevotia lacus]SMC29272.1 ADP-ribosylglycohydrolase [Andreprevotia lacus DSM 23236]
MTVSEDRYLGCVLGLAMGDTLGAPYEGGPLERTLWRLIGRTRDGLPRWSDDTQMTLDLAESLLACGQLDQDDLAQRFAASYRWQRGYGPSTARLLKRIRRGEHWSAATTAIYPTGSFGNGAAMRASVLPLFHTGPLDTLPAQVAASAVITHAHPHGIAGAQLIATATHLLLRDADALEVMTALLQQGDQAPYAAKLTIARDWLAGDAGPHARDVARQLGNGMTAPTSCVTAIYLALRHLDQPFDTLMSFTIKLGGDVDTIAAMAGTLWGTRNGAAALPQHPLEQEARLRAAALALHRHAQQR